MVRHEPLGITETDTYILIAFPLGLTTYTEETPATILERSMLNHVIRFVKHLPVLANNGCRFHGFRSTNK
jgi:hypothetical protein